MIGVTLLGQHLPGSPYVAHATPPLPSAPHCVLRGVALTSAVARREETFEIQFRDYLCAPPYVSRAYGAPQLARLFTRSDAPCTHGQLSHASTQHIWPSMRSLARACVCASCDRGVIAWAVCSLHPSPPICSQRRLACVCACAPSVCSGTCLCVRRCACAYLRVRQTCSGQTCHAEDLDVYVIKLDAAALRAEAAQHARVAERSVSPTSRAPSSPPDELQLLEVAGSEPVSIGDKEGASTSSGGASNAPDKSLSVPAAPLAQAQPLQPSATPSSPNARPNASGATGAAAGASSGTAATGVSSGAAVATKAVATTAAATKAAATKAAATMAAATKAGAASSHTQPPSAPGQSQSPSASPDGAMEHGNVPSRRVAGAQGFVPMLNMGECMVTSRKPLVVRSGLALDSPKVGALKPGQRIKLIDVHTVVEQSGAESVRAKVVLQQDSTATDAPAEGPGSDWRLYSSHRPRFLDGEVTPRSPYNSARRSSAGSPRMPSARSIISPLGGVGGFHHSSPRQPHHNPSTPTVSSSRQRSSHNVVEAAALGSQAAAHRPSLSRSSSFLRSNPSLEGTHDSSADVRARAGAPASLPSDGQPMMSEEEHCGWVTIYKGERELVTPRSSLAASARQQHMMQWARRVAVDRSLAAQTLNGTRAQAMKGDKKTKVDLDDAIGDERKSGTAATRRKGRSNSDPLASTARQGQSIYANELASDPRRIGFAFGGVEPGRLHAHGQLVETHKVIYSIAMTGTYRLHVGLRHDGIELPGSPFLLRVSAGSASALSTALPADSLPLQGIVGEKRGDGCEVVLQAQDKMGNVCSSGGAQLVCRCPEADYVQCSSEDREDGTYVIKWYSCVSGDFETQIFIDGVPIIGSPAQLRLLPDAPDLTQCEVTGSALSKAVAGRTSTLRIKCKDQARRAWPPLRARKLAHAAYKRVAHVCTPLICMV